MGVGDTITWETIHGPTSGVIIEKRNLGFLVRLINQKVTIVHKKSIKNGVEIHKGHPPKSL